MPAFFNPAVPACCTPSVNMDGCRVTRPTLPSSISRIHTRIPGRLSRARRSAGSCPCALPQRLAQRVVDPVRALVVQVLPLQTDLRAAQVGGHALCRVKPAGAARAFVEQRRQLRLKGRVGLGLVIGGLQLDRGGLIPPYPPSYPFSPVRNQ